MLVSHLISRLPRMQQPDQKFSEFPGKTKQNRFLGSPVSVPLTIALVYPRFRESSFDLRKDPRSDSLAIPIDFFACVVLQVKKPPMLHPAFQGTVLLNVRAASTVPRLIRDLFIRKPYYRMNTGCMDSNELEQVDFTTDKGPTNDHLCTRHADAAGPEMFSLWSRSLPS